MCSQAQVLQVIWCVPQNKQTIPKNLLSSTLNTLRQLSGPVNSDKAKNSNTPKKSDIKNNANSDLQETLRNQTPSVNHLCKFREAGTTPASLSPYLKNSFSLASLSNPAAQTLHRCLQEYLIYPQDIYADEAQ